MVQVDTLGHQVKEISVQLDILWSAAQTQMQRRWRAKVLLDTCEDGEGSRCREHLRE